jgi:hypothetical protein
LKQQIETAINNHLSNIWQHTLQGLGTDNIQDTWRITRTLTNDTNNIPPLKLNNRSAITNQEKVKLFPDTLQDIFTTNADGDPNFSEVTEITARSFLSQTPLSSVRKTNNQEIGWIIRHLKARKAAGPNDIQNVVLKYLPMMALKRGVK